MRRVATAAAGASASLAGLVITEWMDVGTGWGDVVQVVLGAIAAVCAASGWWLYQQVRAERRYDAALDAELEALEAQRGGRVVTLSRPARCAPETDRRSCLPGGFDGRSRVFAAGATTALVILAAAVIQPDIGWAGGNHTEPPSVEPQHPADADFVLPYRPAGTRGVFPNGCAITYTDVSVEFTNCPGTLADSLGGVTTDQP